MWLDKDALDKIGRHGRREDSYYQNCGGFALNVDAWYQLGPTIEWFNAGLSRCTRKGGWRQFERSCVARILKDNPELRIVDTKLIDDVMIDLDVYEIIAFRIRRNWLGSYHFMKCEPNGDWLEKRGHCAEIYRHTYETIHDVWDGYDGKEFFFIRERTR